MFKPTPVKGFSLIELILVVFIISVFASIVAPRLFNRTDETKIIVANTTVKNIQKKIREYREINGQWPTQIDRAWFVSKKYPRSPFAPDHVGDTININDSPAKWHPGYKTLGTYPPFWYCRGNGAFRIRVPAQATDAETIKLYNAANMSDVSSIGEQSY